MFHLLVESPEPAQLVRGLRQFVFRFVQQTHCRLKLKNREGYKRVYEYATQIQLYNRTPFKSTSQNRLKRDGEPQHGSPLRQWIFRLEQKFTRLKLCSLFFNTTQKRLLTF